MSEVQTEVAPSHFTLPDAVRYTGLSRSLLYRKLATSELRAVKVGKRTLIAREELDRFLAGLPVYSAKVE